MMAMASLNCQSRPHRHRHSRGKFDEDSIQHFQSGTSHPPPPPPPLTPLPPASYPVKRCLKEVVGLSSEVMVRILKRLGFSPELFPKVTETVNQFLHLFFFN
ncbi:hypothetical protein E2C01_083484 [Portunus trituberculatus]|uniref:Uncharacterized protein n=1 Tax=Portunus trituberculatus TaxID=210409 RepID=A0A5B7IXB6_PORTR|nr:hypothetical protein [Portunus trituberculatus]